MNTFHLTIVTPDGLKYAGEVTSLSVRSTVGAVTLLAHHIDYVTTIGMGPCKVGFIDGHRTAALIGGMLTMTDNTARLIATSFEWADEIDLSRAENALSRAEGVLASDDIKEADKKLAEAAKKRALVRISCVNALQKNQ